MATLNVGAGQAYSTLAAAVAASRNGDVIAVQAGTYVNDFATITTRITIVGVGGMANFVATVPPPNGKGILVTQTDVTVQNLSFSGAAVADGNGAGIRYEGGNLVVIDSYFHNNQDGILANANPTGTIRITGSEFAHNGTGDGYTHNLYVNNIASLVIDDSYFHDAVVGHEIKSRAQSTIITNTRIYDNNGSASYSIDIPNGGVANIHDNVIQQSASSQNPAIIHYGGESEAYAGSSLSIANNVVVNDLTSSSSARLLSNATTVTATISGEDVYGLTSSQIASGPANVSGTTFLSTRPTLDTSAPWLGGGGGTNHAPVAVADTNAGDAVSEAGVNPGNTAFAGDASATGNVLTNDTDSDSGDTKTVTTTGSFTGTFGSLSLAANGTWTYTLNNADPDTQALTQGQSVNDVFNYTIRDTAGATSSSTLTVTITGANDTPVAVADTNAGDAVSEAGVNPDNTPFAGDSSATGNVLTNDIDSDASDTKTVTTTGSFTGTYGSLSLAANGTWTYTLNNADADTQALAQGQSVTDVFNYTMRDTAGATSSSTLSIIIAGTSDTATGGPQTIESSGTTSLVMSANHYVIDNPSGPDTTLKYDGGDVTAGQFGEWAPIGVEASAGGGYDVVWKMAGADQYIAWHNDGNGNYVSSSSVMSGNDAALRNLETQLKQDLNSDGTIGGGGGGGGTGTISGTDGADTLAGTANAETLFGGAGDDVLIGGAGADVLNGGTGSDRAQYSDAPAGLTVDMQAPASNTGIATGDSYVSIENLYGSNFNDTLRADGLDNILWGAAGNDYLEGRAGADTLFGDAGADTLFGGPGADTIVGGGGADIIGVGSNDSVQDVVRFTAVADYGDTASNFDVMGTAAQADVLQFTGALNTLFDDVTNDDIFTFAVGNGVNSGNTAANLNTVEALYLGGTNGEGVVNASLGSASAVAAEFNSEFAITVSNGQDALLVINDTNSNSFAVWQYTESTGGGEIAAAELTLIGMFNANGNATTSEFMLM